MKHVNIFIFTAIFSSISFASKWQSETFVNIAGLNEHKIYLDQNSIKFSIVKLKNNRIHLFFDHQYGQTNFLQSFRTPLVSSTGSRYFFGGAIEQVRGQVFIEFARSVVELAQSINKTDLLEQAILSSVNFLYSDSRELSIENVVEQIYLNKRRTIQTDIDQKNNSLLINSSKKNGEYPFKNSFDDYYDAGFLQFLSHEFPSFSVDGQEHEKIVGYKFINGILVPQYETQNKSNYFHQQAESVNNDSDEVKYLLNSQTLEASASKRDIKNTNSMPQYKLINNELVLQKAYCDSAGADCFSMSEADTQLLVKLNLLPQDALEFFNAKNEIDHKMQGNDLISPVEAIQNEDIKMSDGGEKKHLLVRDESTTNKKKKTEPFNNLLPTQPLEKVHHDFVDTAPLIHAYAHADEIVQQETMVLNHEGPQNQELIQNVESDAEIIRKVGFYLFDHADGYTAYKERQVGGQDNMDEAMADIRPEDSILLRAGSIVKAFSVVQLNDWIRKKEADNQEQIIYGFQTKITDRQKNMLNFYVEANNLVKELSSTEIAEKTAQLLPNFIKNKYSSDEDKIFAKRFLRFEHLVKESVYAVNREHANELLENAPCPSFLFRWSRSIDKNPGAFHFSIVISFKFFNHREKKELIYHTSILYIAGEGFFMGEKYKPDDKKEIFTNLVDLFDKTGLFKGVINNGYFLRKGSIRGN